MKWANNTFFDQLKMNGMILGTPMNVDKSNVYGMTKGMSTRNLYLHISVFYDSVFVLSSNLFFLISCNFLNIYNLICISNQ